MTDIQDPEADLLAAAVAVFEAHFAPYVKPRGGSHSGYGDDPPCDYAKTETMRRRVLAYLSERYIGKPQDPTQYYTLDQARNIPMAQCGVQTQTVADSPTAQAIHLHFGKS
jgi:hypothetical protein